MADEIKSKSDTPPPKPNEPIPFPTDLIKTLNAEDVSLIPLQLPQLVSFLGMLGCVSGDPPKEIHLPPGAEYKAIYTPLFMRINGEKARVVIITANDVSLANLFYSLVATTYRAGIAEGLDALGKSLKDNADENSLLLFNLDSLNSAIQTMKVRVVGNAKADVNQVSEENLANFAKKFGKTFNDKTLNIFISVQDRCPPPSKSA